MAVDHMNTTAPPLVPPPPPSLSRRFDEINDQSWSKLAKRSKRARIEQNSSIEENLATCLLMLARGGATNSTTSAATTPAKTNSYACSVCNKAFQSHQALGGHKASHRTKPPTSAVSAVVDDGKQSNAVDGRVHECGICHRTFPSGQALGGHKRKHYEGIIGKSGGGATSSGSGVTTSEGGATSFSDGDKIFSVPRDFDLNLPPPPEVFLF